MKVQIVNDKSEIIWERRKGAGITSRAYATDGTLEEIIFALKDALEQAEGQLWAFNDSDAMADVSAAAT